MCCGLNGLIIYLVHDDVRKKLSRDCLLFFVSNENIHFTCFILGQSERNFTRWTRILIINVLFEFFQIIYFFDQSKLLITFLIVKQLKVEKHVKSKNNKEMCE